MTRLDLLNKISKAQKSGPLKLIVTVCTLPKGPKDKDQAYETLINNKNLETKIEYLLKAYDENLVLKTHKEIKLVDCIIV